METEKPILLFIFIDQIIKLAAIFDICWRKDFKWKNVGNWFYLRWYSPIYLQTCTLYNTFSTH